MKYLVLHESRNRLRVRLLHPFMRIEEADILESVLNSTEGIRKAEVSERTGNAVIFFDGSAEEVLRVISLFSFEDCEKETGNSSRRLRREYEAKLVRHVLLRGAKRLFLPSGIRDAVTTVHALKYIAEGMRSVLSGKLEISVLDALTVGISVIRGNHDTASDIMFLLGISEILEEWTHKKAVDDLARSMELKIDRVWLRMEDGTETDVPVSSVRKGECIVVRTAGLIPLDGTVVSGEARVNQASLTGESEPVFKKEGSYVYAGTVLEEGECVIRVSSAAGSGRYDSIVRMIEESEKLASESENRAARIADSLVPWCLCATGAAWLLTRNATRALAVLMVDFSCALKLSIPISVLSAMRDAGDRGISVKGGKYLEIISKADTIVFDKTGTLTCAVPAVKMIIPFGGNDETEMLRLAACLEEHFPHSIANAVTGEAKRRGIVHEEKHSRVQYVAAHGIVSSIDGKRTLIGSYHFVFEDEKCRIPEGEEDKFRSLPDEYSLLYLAIGGELAAVICIEDPLRHEAAEVIRLLHDEGFRRIIMMTGDSEKTARSVAQRIGVDRYYAEVLPEDKADFIDREHENGRTVIMIGDGINDTPALARADAAVAIASGASIAREVADITMTGNSLYSLVEMRRLSEAMIRRMRSDYRFILLFNSALIAGGVLGILQPSVTAYAHNFSTMALGLYSLSRFPLKKEL